MRDRSFRPAGAVPFLKLPSCELQNQHVESEDLWGSLARELRERAVAARTPEAKLRVVELVLLQRAAGMFDGQPVVEYAVENFLLQPATARITEIADKTGFSSRRFIELFKQHVGMTPKLFCRVRRFQEVLRGITSGRLVNWTDTALQFVAEVSEGRTPWGPRKVAHHYYVEDCDAVFAHSLANGCQQLQPMADQFYGDRSGSLLDSWGNHWYIASHLEDLTTEEIAQRAAAAGHQ